MDGFIQGEKKKGTNKLFLVCGVLAVLVVVGIVVGVIMIPSPEAEREAILENAFHKGSPEFDSYTKNIVIATDPDRMFTSYTGLGGIVMQIGGSIYNKGDKTVDGLEIRVGMIDTKNKVIKDKKFLVIPKEHPQLKPKEKIDVSVNIPGFEKDDDRANARWEVTAIKFK